MPFDCTDSRGRNPGPDPAPPWWQRAACRAALACHALICASFALAVSIFGALAVATGDWVAGGVAGVFAAFASLPFRLPLAGVRALAAGRWP